jgi:tetratricopeptide (TPR) repeat protein
MSRQTFTIQPSESPQAPISTFPSVGWSIVLLLLGGAVGWQLARRRTPQTPGPKNKTGHSDEEQPNFTQVLQWVGHAKAFEKLNQYDEAVAIYDRGLTQHPQDFRLWHERGLALARLGRFEAAIASYDRAYELKPNQRDLAHERGDALLKLERYEAAIASFNVYLTYAPNSAHVLSDQGYALYQLNRYEEALQSLNRALNSNDRDRNAKEYAHYYQIASLQQLGQLEAAIKSCQTAMQRYAQDSFKTQYEALRQQISET